MKDSGFDPARDITTRPCFPTIFSICWQEGYSKRLHQQTLALRTEKYKRYITILLLLLLLLLLYY